ncbi:YihY/virulence factor BrkB family protein [Pontibacter qinzhouensis]|uniref:YihY/virulence factor BrkB family protein n=1 Tax=Pontibacter qinzhouensis TaxID=2603253 RepID=A0A5C8K8G9_9BACT|nr:YihY/virulence factor BrkB family protein [Pontibacter qinzhouensis]TXK48072.1 YihY/virulence factor BrkB family protein [Pontibacter qinzhouensis]
MKNFLKHTWQILKNAKKNFQHGEPIVYSAAIAFFTIFSLPAILIVLTLTGSAFFSEEKVRQEIVRKIGGLINPEASGQINDLLENVLDFPVGFWGIFVAIVVVIKSATIIFFIIQKALNAVWQVRVKPNVKYIRFLKHRLITLAMVAGLGLLLVLSILLNTIIAIFSEQLLDTFEQYFTPIVRVINTAFYLVVVFGFFTAVHKVLPDARISWKDALAGGAITSILFLIGKQVINLILGSIKIVGIYAAAGSLVVVLLWVFYSSVILILGAEVTKAYANNRGREVEPTEIAQKFEHTEVETGV